MSSRSTLALFSALFSLLFFSSSAFAQNCQSQINTLVNGGQNAACSNNGFLFNQVESNCGNDPSFPATFCDNWYPTCPTGDDRYFVEGVTIPSNGLFPSDQYRQNQIQFVIDEYGYSRACAADIVEAQRQAKYNIVQAAQSDNFISSAINTQCTQPWEQANSFAGDQDSYVARIVGSEEAPEFAHPCNNCQVTVAGQTFTADLGDTGWSQRVTYCNNGSTVVLGNGEPRACANQHHIHYTVRALRSSGNTVENSVLEAQTAFCSSEGTGVGHRPGHGCFAPNAKILMGDKTYKMAKNIAAGEFVWNPVLQKAVRVKRAVVGPEYTPLYDISYGGKTLRVTGRHPMVTPKSDAARLVKTSLTNKKLESSASKLGYSVVMAEHLAVGDMVIGADGKAYEITTFEKLPLEEDQLVHNFVLDGPEDSIAHHSMVAEGFVTGDLLIQEDVNKPLYK